MEERAKLCFDNQSWERDEKKSYYNNNYYKVGNEMVYAESDDDNTTDYYLVDQLNKYAFRFAYSLVSNGDELQWDID